MSTEIKYIPLGGGLNLIDSQVTMPDGMMTECINFEQVFGKQGYHRISGFERYDGHLEPHDATYYILEFDTGTVEIEVGDIVTGTAATGDVLLVELGSGTWAGGDAAGRLILGNVTGAWANDENIQVSAATRAVAAAASYLGSISETLDSTYRALAIEDRRDAISALPGSGSVLGIGIADGVVYAARNVADGTTATLYKATASGWTAVKEKLYPGGRFRMIQANFSGSTESLFLFGCDGKNRPFRFDGTTFAFIDPIYDTQATSTTSLSIGTGAKVFTAAEGSRGWATGQSLIAWSTADAGKWMIGTVTSYSDPTLTLDVTSVGGSGTVDDWEIGRLDFADKPFDMIDHSDHMFLAYPYGQLQTSNLGDPMTYTSTAALFGLGQEINGLLPLKGGVLAVVCTDKTDIISGADKTTWSKETLARSSGGARFTAQELANNGIALGDRGLTSMQATQAFGDFEMGVFSRYIDSYIKAVKPSVVDSRVVKSKNQYRLYVDSGIVLTCTILSPNAVITPNDVSFTRANYGVNIACCASGEIGGEEYHFFGTDEGYVMREDVGASFDGEAIASVFRLPFMSFKSPANKKRFRKLVIDIDAPQLTTIYFKEIFDYGDGTYAPSINFSTDAYGGGGKWDASDWDEFLWSLPVQTQAEANIAGVGRNMSLLIWHESALDDAFSIQGLLVHYSILGMTR